MEKKEIIVAQLPSGFRDYLPEDMIPRQKMFDTIRSVFERFGFLPIETPGVQKEDVLTGGDPAFDKNIYEVIQYDLFKTLKVAMSNTPEFAKRKLEETLGSSKDGMALRFDLTVSLARYTAQYGSQIKMPFKRYERGKVWRGENPQAGRYREFTQFDADTIGSGSMMADAEIVAVMYATMKELGVENFLIRVNNRKILNGLAEFAGFDPEKNAAVLRSIDKLDKIGWEGVESELCDKKGESGLEGSQAQKVKQFLDLRGEGKEDLLNKIGQLMQNSPSAQEGVKELFDVVRYVRSLGVPDDKWTIDISVARGLGYYTGPVFETMLLDLPSIGSVFSGGRYDDLVERFGGGSLPATGASVGVDRLFDALEKLGKLKREGSIAKVMVLNFDPKAEEYVQELATILRDGGIPTQVYFGKESKLRDQLGFASTAKIPAVVIAGGNEMEKGVVQVKDMEKGGQETIDKNEILAKVMSVLAR